MTSGINSSTQSLSPLQVRYYLQVLYCILHTKEVICSNLATQVMFAALSTVMIQGILPEESDDSLFYLFALTCGISFSSLFITIVVCVETLLMASKFMVLRTRELDKGLKLSYESIKMLMKTLDCPSEWQSILPKLRNYLAGVDSENAKKELKDIIDNLEGGREKEIISQLPNHKIDETFEDGQTIVRLLLEVRPKINNSYMVNVDSQTFEYFWDKNCSSSCLLAINCFYLGTLFMLCAAMVFNYAQFSYTYDHGVAGLISIFCIMCSLICGVYVKYDMHQKWGVWERSVSMKSSTKGAKPVAAEEVDNAIPRSRTWWEMFDDLKAAVTGNVRRRKYTNDPGIISELSPLRR